MQLKDILEYYDSIERYCNEKRYYEDMLYALEQDASLDNYLSAQPGGAGVLSKHKEDVTGYTRLLENMSAETIFGHLYRISPYDDQNLLNYLLLQSEEICSTSSVPDKLLNPLYEAFDFLSQLSYSDHPVASCKLDNNSIDQFINSGIFIVKNMVIYTYEDKGKETVTRNWDINEVLNNTYFMTSKI